MTRSTRSVVDAIIAGRDRLPPIRFDCGSTDPPIEPDRELHARPTAAGVPHEWDDPSGGHEWPYLEASRPRSGS